MPAWDEPDPAQVLELRGDRDWNALNRRYDNLISRPFERCLEVARAGGARTAVIETRYLDRDYRSEYSAFFSRTFADIPDNAQRIHFFRARVAPTRLWQLPPDPGYLGYIIVRPSPLGRVGRALLVPPPDVQDHVQCAVAATVTFFGQQLTVTGVPFAQQDTQFGRCAHIAAWVCHHTAALRGEVPSRTMAEFSLEADPNVAEGRPLPSQGLTGLQLSNLMRDFGLPPIVYRMGYLPSSGHEPQLPPHDEHADPGTWDTRSIAVACRFLNSGFPVLVGTTNHAFVLIGYRREQRGRGYDWISFVRHDDQRGPYLTVENVLDDVDPSTGHAYGPWTLLLAPVPEKLWLLPEAAERSGHDYLLALDSIQPIQHLAELQRTGHLTFRTYATTANDFKRRAATRGLGSAAVSEYRLARFSRMLWVVEAVDRQRRRRGQAAVVGEAVFDPTSSDTLPRPLSVRVPGALLIAQTNGQVRYPIPATLKAVSSGAICEP